MGMRVFCEICRDDVEYIVEEKEMSGKIRGIEYSYIGKEARCANCGAYVDVEEIRDANLKSLYDIFRESNDIISLEKIREIPERYDIGKRPLSNLLGWGEHTFSRYSDGDIPTRQYSDMLNRLYDDPSYYLNFLEENKTRLPSDLSYEKSRKAVENIMRQEEKDSSKIDHVISYLLNQCEDITPLALQKSLYYIQGFYRAFFGSFMFTEDCQAWAHGPVYRDVYKRYADYHFDPISKVEIFDSSVFTSQEKAVMDSVIKNIACYSGKVMESFTHNETPWLYTRGNLANGAPSDRIIDKNIIAEYFINIKEKYRMNTPMDIQLYTKEMFESL